MGLFDIIFLIILLFFIWKGFRAGLVGAIGGFVGIIVGIWAGSHYMQLVSEWLMNVLNIENASLSNILAFVLIFIAINIITSIIVAIINRIFHIIPFMDLINKLLGAIVGVLGGALVIIALVHLLSIFPISEAIGDKLLESTVANQAADFAIIVKPFIPTAINELKTIFEYVN